MSKPCWLLELPEELLIHVGITCLSPSCGCDVVSAQKLSWTSSHLHEKLHVVKAIAKASRHSLRWGVQRLDTDIVLSASGRGLRAAVDQNWCRAYGKPLRPRGCSTWAVRIDQTRANQGMMQIGISLVDRNGACEWSLSPFYGRLIRRCWDRDGNLLVAAPPPLGYPDGHLRKVLVDAEGTPTTLEGRAVNSVIEVIFDHDAGYLAFRLDGGPEGAVLAGFPVEGEQSGGGASNLLRPVIGFRWAEDQVTIRSGERLRSGWPQQDPDVARLRDARGLQAAKALSERAAGATGGEVGVAGLTHLRRLVAASH